MIVHVASAAPAGREVRHVVTLVVLGVEFVCLCGSEGIGEAGWWQGASAVARATAAVGHGLGVVGSGLVDAVGHVCDI